MANDTFAYLNIRVGDINRRMLTDAQRIETAYVQVDAAVVDLTQLGPDNAQVSADVDAQAAANPTDPAWQDLKAKKDLLVAEFGVQKTNAEDLQSAMQPWAN